MKESEFCILRRGWGWGSEEVEESLLKLQHPEAQTKECPEGGREGGGGVGGSAFVGQQPQDQGATAGVAVARY